MEAISMEEMRGAEGGFAMVLGGVAFLAVFAWAAVRAVQELVELR